MATTSNRPTESGVSPSATGTPGGVGVPRVEDLFELQLGRLGEGHFLALYWATVSEFNKTNYNITNYFDDLKHLGLTRTKQTAVASIEALHLMGLIDLRDARNRKNIFITRYGASALQRLVKAGKFKSRPSEYLESSSK